MLYRSGENLENGVIAFLDKNESVTLFSAYLKLDQLIKINSQKRIKQIIVRWEIQDLCLGISDLELYEYCLTNKITLKRNTRIHLKAFWNNKSSVMFGSANVTKRGLGEGFKYNFELNGQQEYCSNDDRIYFQQIILKSEFISEELYQEIINKVEEAKKLPKVTYPVLETKKQIKDEFLLSQLPMFEKIESLYVGYQNPNTLNEMEVSCLIHDLVLYNIPKNLNKDIFYLNLKHEFNNHAFILALKNKVQNDPRSGLGYGRTIRWIQDNTTTDPTPRSWEFKKDQIINILFNWISFFDNEFTHEIKYPNGSDLLVFKSNTHL